jgi:ankyrin repeat protein
MQQPGEPVRSNRALVSALVDAADLGIVAAARAALDGGAEPNCRGLAPPHDRPLHYAAARGRLACVQLLLDHGAAVDGLNDDDVTPLIRAVSHDHVACARLLLSHGAAVDAMDSLGWRPLHHAAASGSLACLRLLLDERSSAVNTVTNMDAGGDTPLHLAVAYGFVDCAQLLLDHGALVGALRLDDTRTPLHTSAGSGSTPCLQLLLARGAVVDFQSSGDLTPLHLVAEEGHHENMRLLLEHGARASIDSVCIRGLTALHYAVLNGRRECTQLLLDNGAATSIMDEDGETPLSCAATCVLEGENEYPLECARLLLAHGAALDDRSSAAFASCASERHDRELAFLLLWRGVHVPSPNQDEMVEEDAAENLLLDLTLTKWQSGGLRCWTLDTHALFPAAFRADAAATLLATLGSLDGGSAEADDVPRAARRRPGMACGQTPSASPARLQNPLLMLRQQHVLDNMFTALLVAHMGGPAAVANPAPPAAVQPQ